MREGTHTEKCRACDGVYLKSELSDDGRCLKCVFLARHGLAKCPHCGTDASIGWNPAADFQDVFPIVYIACKPCGKRLKVVQVSGFAHSPADAIQKANEADQSAGQRPR